MIEKPFYWKARKAWYFHVTGPDGKRSARKLGDTKREADAKWLKLKAAAEAETPALVVCIGEFLEWARRELRRKKIAQSTVEGWEDYLSLASIEFEAVHVGDFRPADVLAWIAKNKQWGISSEWGAVGALKRYLNWCVEHGIIETS